MIQLKTIEEIPQYPMDAWQVAVYLYGQSALDLNHSLASKAASKMEKAGWTFSHYDDTYGEEIYDPPPQNTDKGKLK
jgi:hypothetical protein